MTHNVFQLDVQDWARFQGRVSVMGQLFVNGQEIKPATDISGLAGQISGLDGRVGLLESLPSASTLFVSVNSRLSTLESASASYGSLQSRVGVLESASASYVQKPLPAYPVAVISPKSPIVLLATLLGRVDQITDSLVNAGMMRYQ